MYQVLRSGDRHLTPVWLPSDIHIQLESETHMSVCTTREWGSGRKGRKGPLPAHAPTFPLHGGRAGVLSQVAHTPLPEILPLNLALRRAWEGMSLPCRSRGFQDALSLKLRRQSPGENISGDQGRQRVQESEREGLSVT